MSNYKNFIKDFPRRTGDLLRWYYAKAKHSDREVTFLLALFMAGYIIPAERFRTTSLTIDSERFARAGRSLNELFAAPFVGSKLWSNPTAGSWIYATDIPVRRVKRGNVDYWPELQRPSPFPAKLKTQRVLTILRNSLAHGSILTRGSPSIEQIVFISWIRTKGEVMPTRCRLLAVSPHDFYKMAQNWVKFAEELPT
jgi:hypothetical protein